MKKLLIIIGISVFFLMIAAGAAYNSQIIHVDQLYRNMPSSTCYQPTTDKPHEDAVWNLDECYWFVDDPNIPYELQLVLDYCSDSYHYSDDLLVFTNETHYIDNGDCVLIVSLDWEKDEEQKRFEDVDLNTKGCPQFCPKDDE